MQSTREADMVCPGIQYGSRGDIFDHARGQRARGRAHKQSGLFNAKGAEQPCGSLRGRETRCRLNAGLSRLAGDQRSPNLK